MERNFLQNSPVGQASPAERLNLLFFAFCSCLVLVSRRELFVSVPTNSNYFPEDRAVKIRPRMSTLLIDCPRIAHNEERAFHDINC